MWIPPAHSPFDLRHALAAAGAGTDALGRLRRELRSTHRADEVVLTASGTHALQLALETARAALDADAASVALPAYSCFDLVTAALAVQARVTFYDVDPVTLVPDPDSLERVVRRGARIVVAANLFGFPLDWGVLRGIRDEYGALLIEDAAQGLGSTWDGRSAGDLGDYTVFSFARGKGWTGGGGGALLVRGGHPAPEWTPFGSGGGRAGLLARTLAQWMLARPSLYGIPARLPFLGLGETHFKEPSPAAAIHPFQAALAASSRHVARVEVARRRDAATRLRLALQGVPSVELPTPVAGGSPGWLRLPLRIDGGIVEVPDEWRRLGLYRGYPRVLPDLPQSSRLARLGSPPAVPGARRLVQELLTAPTHSRAPIRRLTEALPAALRARRRS